MFVELVSIENGKPFLIQVDAVESIHPMSADQSIVVSVVTQRIGWTAQPRKYVVKGDYEATKKLFARG
jgi:hypothetical protein